jgi:hypothetical protein
MLRLERGERFAREICSLTSDVFDYFWGSEVAFAESTEDGELRQTTFLGWRDDKRPEEVGLDV